jgi:hypothetical protein
MEREDVRRSNIVTVIVIGLGLGVLTSVLAFVVAGGGHGLVSAMFSLSSLVLAPAAFLAILGRRRLSGKIVALIIAVIGIDFDISIWIEGINEEVFFEVWDAIPASLAIWITCWLSWQFVLLAGMFRPPLKAANE